VNRDRGAMTLAVLFVVAELVDLATYLQAPAFESNPAMQGWPPTVVAAKFVGLTAAAALALIGLTGRKQQFALGVCIAIAAFSAGSNHAILTVVDSLEAPTSAIQPAPVTSGGTGNEQGTQAPAAGSRTPAPRPSATAATVRGLASWYGVDGDVAAAGPALRHSGHWRGSVVAVCADRCVTVRLVDFCQCYRGQRSERVIDLSPSVFARLAPLSAGLIRVSVSPVHVTPPATDTDVPRGTR
jgi:hypothetical protein